MPRVLHHMRPKTGHQQCADHTLHTWFDCRSKGKELQRNMDLACIDPSEWFLPFRAFTDAHLCAAKPEPACWSPGRHRLFHDRVREAIHTVMLVQERLDGRLENSVTGAEGGVVYPRLPDDLWFHVCSMLLRRDWGAAEPSNRWDAAEPSIRIWP